MYKNRPRPYSVLVGVRYNTQCIKHTINSCQNSIVNYVQLIRNALLYHKVFVLSVVFVRLDHNLGLWRRSSFRLRFNNRGQFWQVIPCFILRSQCSSSTSGLKRVCFHDFNDAFEGYTHDQYLFTIRTTLLKCLLLRYSIVTAIASCLPPIINNIM